MEIREASIMLVAFLAISILLAVQSSSAQDSIHQVTNLYEGVAGSTDKNRRSPLVSVTTAVREGKTSLLVDAYVPDSQFDKYPIQFDFYINRRFFTSQIRSPELPGPVGIDIGPDIAPLPFNFAVVARVLHPNKAYTTVFTGAAFATNLTRSMDCTITLTEQSGERSYLANSVLPRQLGNNALSLSFLAHEIAGSGRLNLRGTIELSGLLVSENEASAFLTIEKNGVETTYLTNGNLNLASRELETIRLSSEDGLDVNCH